MDGISGLKKEVVRLLEGDTRLAGVKITPEYPVFKREYPLVKPCISVGVNSMDVSASLGGYMGAGEGGDVYGQMLSVTLRFDIFTPVLKPCDPCGMADILCEILMLQESEIRFTRLSCGDIAYDKTAEANRLTIKADMKVAATLGGDSHAVNAFRLERYAKF